MTRPGFPPAFAGRADVPVGEGSAFAAIAWSDVDREYLCAEGHAG